MPSSINSSQYFDLLIYFTHMKHNQTKQSIQQMQQGQRDFGVLNTMKTIHKKVLNNDLVSEFDVFSVPVKLTFNGSQVYRTFCGGCVYLFLLVSCVAITISILFPSGIALNSQISVTTVPSTQNTQQSLFEHTDEIISWRGVHNDMNGNILGYAEIGNFSTFKAYIQDSKKNSYELEISTTCATEDAQFCIRKSHANQKATLMGNFYDPQVYSTQLVVQKFWCDYILDPNCIAFPFEYSLQVKITNFLKQKGGSILPTTNRILTNWWNRYYTMNVTSQVFTSNNKFFGHLANLLPFETRTFHFSDFIESYGIVDPTIQLISTVPNGTWDYGQIRMTPCGLTRQINENFDDVSEILLFFLSVSETFYIVVFFLFIKQYNRNSGLLEISDSLYYIDDPKTKKKFNFRSGCQVFFACLLFNHPLYKIINFIMIKLGYSLQEALPNKAICAIKLMKKTQEILQENSFYGNLNELNSMETEPSRKIKLYQQEQERKGQLKQLNYFPIMANDSQTAKKDKDLKRLAFDQFCSANQYISPQRKNHAYKVITYNKLKHMLVHEMQTEFMEFVRNAKIQMNNYVYQELPDSQTSMIKVAVHDTSNHPMTAQNFIET